MSIELPEAKILAGQMNRELPGKRIEAHHLKECERLQRIGFINKEVRDFGRLVGRRVESVLSRGNTIRAKLDGGMNLLLAPEYGGEIFFHKDGAIPEKFHLRLDFDDGTALTVRLTSMGGIYAVRDADLVHSYLFRRDFNPGVLSPLEKVFTLRRFSQLLGERARALKSVLVGRDAVVVGLSNSAFQDILYRAHLHPKRKASGLSGDERKVLYDAMRFVIKERIRLKGKEQFLDLYGRRGGYVPAMGPHMKDKNCPACGTLIERLNEGGGVVFFCPRCQM